MTSTLPGRGKDQKRESPSQNSANSAPNKRSRSRSQGAMNDAQQSLKSLLSPQTDDKQPRIITQSGAIRNQTRGRVAAPGTGSNGSRSLKPHAPGSGLLIEGGNHKSDADPLLAIVPGTHPLYDDEVVHAVPQTRLEVGLARATGQMQVMRDRANLLLGTPDAAGGLALDDAALHTSRRAAAQWVSRYATHLVILAIVLALVAFGGLKSLTVVGAYPNGLQSADAYTGTDVFGNDQADTGDNSDSLDYNITLPRTELGSTDAAADSQVVQPSANGGQNAAPQQAPARTTVTAYTVVQGDTIQSVAAQFQVLPETVMGSNGLFDAQQNLTPGQVLNIPPIDGMYYVPTGKDTLDTISRRFQVDPETVSEYPPNNMADGTIKPGVPIVVPGGMMPQRDTTVVYTVKPGDTLKDIAARYGVDVPTMIRSNDIPNPDSLQIGTQLRVLPISGMEYKVQKGDTITSIADNLGVTTQNILDYSPNELTVNSTLQIDQVIMVPGGSPPPPPVVVAATCGSCHRRHPGASSYYQPGVHRCQAARAIAAPVRTQTCATATATISAATPAPTAGAGSSTQEFRQLRGHGCTADLARQWGNYTVLHSVS